MTMVEPLPSGVPPGVGSHQDLLKQLKVFLAGAATASGSRGANPRLAQTALHLLVHLPAARDAVFEYYGTVLDGVVSRHSTGDGNNGPSTTEEEELLIEELQKVLAGFIDANPEAWAPIVSAWSLDNLGRMSSKWSSKISGPPSTLLHDKLSAWLSCSAARCLLELAAACLSTLLTSTDTEACVSSLLDTSVRHSPHFDWVVAHLGSCFPHTVTSRVLSLGLREFAAAASTNPGSAELSLSKIPKLVSVVNILSHLGTTHPIQLEEAVQEVVQASLVSPATPSSTAAIPFLLHLSSLSGGVRRALTSGLANRLTPTLPRLATLAPAWVQNHFFASAEAVLGLAAHLLVQTDQGGGELVLLLLQMGAGGVGEVGTEQAQSLTHLLLAELNTLVHAAPRHRPEETLLLAALDPHLESLRPLLLSNNSFQRSATGQLLILHSVYRGRATSASLLSFLLAESSESSHLATLGQLLGSLELWHPAVAVDAVGRALRGGKDNRGQLLDNLARLLVMETQEEVVWHSSFRAAIGNHLSSLSSMLLAHPQRILLLLSLAPPGPKLQLATLHRLCHALVQVIFSTISLASLSLAERTCRLSQAEVVLSGMARQPAGLQIMLRLLMEAALHSPYSVHLGGFSPELEQEQQSPRQRAALSLLKDNMKFGSMPVQPLGSTTVFHAGTIGSGPRLAADARPVTEEQAEENRREVAGLVVRLAEGQGQEGTKQLALLLVEMVSPDIMYNGLPWPEEEFIKVTIERDLSISRLLSSHPIVWTLLTLLARARPALCYCSVLVRAVVAVSIFHWQSHITSRLTDHPVQLDNTRRVLELMAIGQFLPPQLALVPQVIDIFDPAQLHCILIDIWNFMKLNVPGPSLFSQAEDGEARGEAPTRSFGPYKNYHAFCERLRVVLVSHIDTQAAVVKAYFVDALNGETATNGQGEG